jgi:hypothetical protein
MLSYKNVNVNPKNRKTGDCAVRAICNVLDIPYGDAIDLCAKYAKETCYGITGKQVVELVLKDFGYVKMKQPKKPDGKKYQVREMDAILTAKQMEQGVLVTVANHHTCIKHGCIEDIWNRGGKSVGNYYIKMLNI